MFDLISLGIGVGVGIVVAGVTAHVNPALFNKDVTAAAAVVNKELTTVKTVVANTAAQVANTVTSKV
jgi:hypothetical protein